MKPHFPASQLEVLADRFGTPLYVYHLDTIRARVAQLRGFDVVRYAQKANSNLTLLEKLREEGVEVDAVSAGEIIRALRAGFSPNEIVYTADVFDRAALELISKHRIPVNLGSPHMIEEVPREIGEVTLRINPGFGDGHDAKVVTGGEESKHGIWHEELSEAYRRLRARDLKVRGAHVHVGSGANLETLEKLSSTVARLASKLGEDLRVLSAGGGLPVPYRPGEVEFEVERYLAPWQAAREALARTLGHEVTLETEPGRFLLAEAGVLLARVAGTKRQGSQQYALVDAGFHTFARPLLYNAWHGIRVVGREAEPPLAQQVAGPLCESADVFTHDEVSRERAARELPPIQKGDLIAIEDVGAYGASMASNYNSHMLPAEVLIDGEEARLIRRRQTIEHALELESNL